MAASNTNTAWTVPSNASSVSYLTKQSRPMPTPSANQVLFQITGVSLNYRDVLISTRSPQYPGNHKADLVPGSDGAGIIHSVGSKSSWSGREGLNVLLHPNGWLSGDVRNLSFDTILGGTGSDGTLQQWLVVDDAWVIPAPKHLSAVESASLVTAGATAWSAIRGHLDGGVDGLVRKWDGAWTEKRLQGKTVLTMGTEGVSCFGMQIAAALGATVIATSSSDSKLDLAKSLGATHGINYAKTPDWDQEVLRLTDGKGVDHVLETGGAGTLIKSINSTRSGGLISLLGLLTPDAQIDATLVPSVLFGAKIVKGCLAFHRDATAEFAKFVEAHDIKPVIAQEFEFDQTVQAFEVLQKQNAVGKIGIRIA